MDCGLNVAPISPPLLDLGNLAPPRKMLLEKTHLIEVPGGLLLRSLSVRNLSRRFKKQLNPRIFLLLPRDETTSAARICLPCLPFPSVLSSLVPAKRKTRS